MYLPALLATDPGGSFLVTTAGSVLAVLILLAITGVASVVVLQRRARSRSRSRTRSRQSPRSGRTAVEARSDVPLARDEAELVTAWAESGKVRLLVMNGSPRPVYDVRAFVLLGRRRSPTFAGWVRTLEPADGQPAKVALIADAREAWLRWEDRHASADPEVKVEFTFRDADRQYWHRNRAGGLVTTDRHGAALHRRRGRVN